MISGSCLPAFALLLSVLFRVAWAVNLTVSTTGGNVSSPLLYGIMFEVSQLNPKIGTQYLLHLTQT